MNISLFDCIKIFYRELGTRSEFYPRMEQLLGFLEFQQLMNVFLTIKGFTYLMLDEVDGANSSESSQCRHSLTYIASCVHLGQMQCLTHNQSTTSYASLSV